MKSIAIYSCQAAQDSVVKRRNTHELYGYDFMVDSDFRTWLIEINSSPAMDYSTVPPSESDFPGNHRAPRQIRAP